MRLYRFDNEIGKEVTHLNSNFIMSRIIKNRKSCSNKLHF